MFELLSRESLKTFHGEQDLPLFYIDLHSCNEFNKLVYLLIFIQHVLLQTVIFIDEKTSNPTNNFNANVKKILAGKNNVKVALI